MITVGTLVSKNVFPPELHSLGLWDMDVDEVMPAHLQGFFYRSKMRTSRVIAKEASNLIANLISNANKDKTIRNNRLDNFSISEPPYLSGELRKSLSEMSQVSRRCVYFALLMGWSLDRASSVTWDEIKALMNDGLMYNRDAALDVIESMPRHFKNNLVFWEMSKGKVPISIVGLRLDVEMAFNCTYDELLFKFQTMILNDPAIHSQELKKIWGI